MTLSAVQAGAYLHHLAFESTDPERLAKFYATAMDMDLHEISETEWRCEGPDRRMIVVPGSDKTLAYAGFACRDADGLDALRERVAAEGVSLEENPSPYFEPGAFAVRDPDGNLICFGLARAYENKRNAIPGPTQHLTFASFDVNAFMDFYNGKLGFRITDKVIKDDGTLATCFFTSNHEHHTIACFLANHQGIDHHSYEAGDWNYIRDWCDHFSTLELPLVWGPGRHGPGNNLFAFIEDPDGNYIEVSAELEVVHDRPEKIWPHAPRTLNYWGRAIMRS